MVAAPVRLDQVKRPICFAAALFEHQDTHFSALGLLPVHINISDGALGFAGPLEHVACSRACVLWPL